MPTAPPPCDQLNLSAGCGIFGLLGPNGAGKSSLLRTIATLQAADSGDIQFNQLNVRQQPALLRAQLGYLPQEFGVYPHMSCQALLEHIAILKRPDRPPQPSSADCTVTGTDPFNRGRR